MIYNAAYLIGTIMFIPLWVIIFLARKDLRKCILFISLLGGISSLLTEAFFVADYWHPITITGWEVSFEDFMFGFFVGGIAAGIYKTLFKKKFAKNLEMTLYKKRKTAALLLVIYLSFVFLNKVLEINSMGAIITVFGVVIFSIMLKRRDMILNVFISGILMASISIVFYFFYTRIFPDIIQKWWYLTKLSGLTLNGIPIEEFLWFYVLGMFTGPFYEFVTGTKFDKVPAKKNH